MSNDNPYAPTVPQTTPNREIVRRTKLPSVYRIATIWLLVFLFNLVVPTMFGFMVCRTSEAVYGMVAAVVISFFVSLAFCLRYPKSGQLISRGAVLVAVSQVFPVIHFFAGMAAFVCVSWLLQIFSIDLDTAIGIGVDNASSPIGTALLTFFVGGQLMLVSLVLGLILRVVTPSEWWIEDKFEEDGEQERYVDR